MHVSQLIRYGRACSACNQFLSRSKLLTNKLLSKGFQLLRLKATFRKFYGRFPDIQSVIKLNTVRHIKPFLYTDFDCGLIAPSTRCRIWLTASVTVRCRTCQQGMFTQHRHQIPPLVYPGVHVCHALIFVLFFFLLRRFVIYALSYWR